MKFKVKILPRGQLKVESEPSPQVFRKLSISGSSNQTSVAIPGDQIEFQKQVYQTI